MNLGPQAFYTFCNLNIETAEHIFQTCIKTQGIWNLISSVIRKPINLSHGISSGIWLCQDLTGNDLFTQSVIASTIWFIWKTRCNKIFKNDHLDYQRVSSQAIGHVREYFNLSPFHIGNFFYIKQFFFL